MLPVITHTNSIRSVDDLAAYLQTRGIDWAATSLPSHEQLQKLHQTFPIRIPQHYADLIDWKNPHDPLRKLVLPPLVEADQQPYELPDPIGDHDREVVPGLIHRYPDRCLLLLTTYCLVHCRFCFRKDVVGEVRPVDFAAIRAYLTNHQEVHELIFSGGDPLTFPVGFLMAMGQQLGPIDHIKQWRFHTRVPAVDPESVGISWLETLTNLAEKHRFKPIIVIHIDHPRELTSETTAFINHCLDRNIMLLSQTVLLKGVNDDERILAELFRSLVHVGVKPYYLHHLDRALGTHHFRLSIAEGQKLYQSLRGHLSTVALPEYVLDLPGGFGKVPVMWLEQLNDHTYQTETFEGKKVTYSDYGVATP